MGPKRPLLSRGIQLTAATAAGVPVEWLAPVGAGAAPVGAGAAPVVLYLHGGGWVLGWYNSHRWLLGQIGLAAGCRALAVDYRLAPEHPFPAALNDCLGVYRWLVQQGTAPRQIVIAGDSAGGNLTLTTLLALRDAGDPLPAAGVCISPMTDLEGTGETFNRTTDPLLSAKFALDMARHYAGGQDARQPLISPVWGDLRGLPPLLVHVGADEILLSDAQRLEAAAHAAGVDARLRVWPAMWHVWHIFAPFLPEARQAVAEIGEFVREQTSRPGG